MPILVTIAPLSLVALVLQAAATATGRCCWPSWPGCLLLLTAMLGLLGFDTSLLSSSVGLQQLEQLALAISGPEQLALAIFGPPGVVSSLPSYSVGLQQLEPLALVGGQHAISFLDPLK